MKNRKFSPCIYLFGGNAVKSTSDHTVLERDPVSLAKYYCEQDADELLIFDLGMAGNGAAPAGDSSVSAEDADHDRALDLMKEICLVSEVDVYGGGRIRRMEDVKKILYAGCKKAILNYDESGNIGLTEEVSLKFGREKILVSFTDPQILKATRSTLEQYASGLILRDERMVRESLALTQLPLLVEAKELPLNKMLEYFGLESVVGLTGNAVNNNVKEILSLKELCIQNGIPVETLTPAIPWASLKKNSDGLVPVIVQDYRTDEVLMLAYMNEDAYLHTLKCGKMTYYSRSRKERWLKGETSGHYQYVKSLHADCDMDTILAKVSQVGAACHTGARSCFFNEIVKKDVTAPSNPLQVFEDVFAVIQDRKIHPREGSYTNYLFDKGLDKILKKLGEEATEIVIAAKNPGANEVKYEISDFLYHMMVLMAERNITWEEITAELANR